MKWRDLPYFAEGAGVPQLMEDGVVYPIMISLWNTSYVFNAGHRVRLDVSSSNYPRFSVNRNNGDMLVDEGSSPEVVARNTIHHSAEYRSRLILPQVSLEQMPIVDIVPDVDIPEEATRAIEEQWKKWASSF
jgi:hypothetical protein